MKMCSKCGGTKPRAEFPRHRGRPDGLDARCKECARLAARNYRKSNLEMVREKDRARVHATPIEVRRQKHKRWRDKNREHVRERGRAVMRQLYQRDPERFRRKSRKWRKENYDKAVEMVRDQRDRLSDAYIATTLQMRVHDLPKPLIEAKRVQLQIHRLLKEIKQ